MVLSNDDDLSESVAQNTITRNKNNWTVQTKNSDKIYRLVYDKRVIMPNLYTFPYGYKFE